jgi:hypothetical protein
MIVAHHIGQVPPRRIRAATAGRKCIAARMENDTMAPRRGRSIHNRFLPLLVVLLTALAAVRPASAQGTSGMLPDPISNQDLARYCDRLGLSDEQRQAVERLLADYRIEFAKLREGEIEQFLEEWGTFWGGFNFNFNADRERVERRVRDLEALMRQVRSIDETFLDSLTGVLTDEQIAMLPRIRQDRARQRYRAATVRGLGMMQPASRVDLTHLIDELSLPAETRVAIDSSLAQYERALTRAVEERFESSLHMQLDMMDALTGEGWTPDAFADPDRAGDLLDRMFAAMNEAQLVQAERAKKIAELNRTTLERIAPLLTADDARRLRQQFYERGYPDAAGGRGSVDRRFDLAIALDELLDEQRAALGDLRRSFDDQWARLAGRMMDLVDQRETGVIRFVDDPEGDAARREREEKIDKLKEDRIALAEQTQDAIDSILGNELADTVRRRIAKEQPESGAEKTAESQVAMLVMIDDRGAGGAAIHSFSGSFELAGEDLGPSVGAKRLPDPIADRQIDRLEKRLELDEGERSIVHTMHDDYVDAFDEMKRMRYAPVREAERRLRPINAEGEPQDPPSAADVSRAFDLKRQAIDAALEADGRFFEDVAVMFDDEEKAAALERERLARQREVYVGQLGGAGGMFFAGGGGGAVFSLAGGGPGREDSVDLSAVVDDLELSDEAQRAIDSALAEYERQITDVFRRRYETSDRMNEQSQRMQARATERTEDGQRTTMRFDPEQMEAVREQTELNRKAKLEIIELNRAARDRIMDQLDADAAERLRRAYNRAAYPGVYRDPASAETRLQAALALDDLSAIQRKALEEIALRFRVEYDRLCDELVALRAADATAGGGGSDETMIIEFDAMQERTRERERLRFERRDLSDGVRGKLRVILDESQIKRIGGLERPAAGPTFHLP